MTRQRVTPNGSNSGPGVVVVADLRAGLGAMRSARSRKSALARMREVVSVMFNPALPGSRANEARFSFCRAPAQLVTNEIAAHADDDLALALSSICSSARTGTRNSLPILTTGISPLAAAREDAFRDTPKYFFPASGTEIVSGSLPINCSFRNYVTGNAMKLKYTTTRTLTQQIFTLYVTQYR